MFDTGVFRLHATTAGIAFAADAKPPYKLTQPRRLVNSWTCAGHAAFNFTWLHALALLHFGHLEG